MSERVAREVRDAEKRLSALAPALDVPIDGLSGEPQFVAVGLGLRGWSLYQGFRRSVTGPSMITAHVDLRAILDVTILARWMEDDPPLRVRLWFAEDQRERLLGFELMGEFQERKGRPRPDPPADWDPEAIDEEIQQARTAAINAGIKIPKGGRRCLPSIEEMVKAVPDLWEAYNVAYRHLSPVQHAGGRSFVRDDVERRSGRLYLRPGSPFDARSLRALAVPALCMLFATISRQVGIGIEEECDRLRLSVVISEKADGP